MATVSKAPIGHATDSCGCATGAKLMLVFLIASAGWLFWHRSRMELSVAAACLRVLLWSFVGMGLGKLVGALRYRRANRQPEGMARRVSGGI